MSSSSDVILKWLNENRQEFAKQLSTCLSVYIFRYFCHNRIEEYCSCNAWDIPLCFISKNPPPPPPPPPIKMCSKYLQGLVSEDT